MKKLLVLFFALLFAIPAAARAATTVTYSFDKAFAPFSFVEKGKAKGFELDILQAALAASGFKLNIKPGNWDQIQRDLDQGKVQVSSGAAKTPERMQKYLYAASPTCKLNVRIFTENKKPIRTITDLPGKRVATQRGSLYHSLIKNIKNINLVLFDTEPQALKALVDGKADAAVIAEKTGRYYINKEGYKNISAVGTPLRMTSVFFIFNKKQQKLAKAVSEGLRNIVSNGQYEKIYKRWFVPKLDENEAAALLKAAALSVRMAYAPYSRFQVGAAVLCGSGRIYTGANVENALLPLTATAVATALLKAVTYGDTDIKAVANVLANGRPTTPAATDRQMVYEFNRGAQVVLLDNNGKIYTRTIAELLPVPFDLE